MENNRLCRENLIRKRELWIEKNEKPDIWKNNLSSGRNILLKTGNFNSKKIILMNVFPGKGVRNTKEILDG